MSSSSQPAAASCPVDHRTREAYVKAAGVGSGQEEAQRATAPIMKTRPLAMDREISTIPRALQSSGVAPPFSSRPSNHEQETGSDATSGNWIYPSEKMFFDAMRRKNYDPKATDMASIIPIHNAVNERAWKQIKDWENRFQFSRDMNKKCNGPQLFSFSGDSSKLSPKARINTFFGYTAPFDRHDWIIQRCDGQQMEYIIDFYAGKQDDGTTGKGLSFHLDVRPKLNSWEGWKMRISDLIGLA